MMNANSHFGTLRLSAYYVFSQENQSCLLMSLIT